MPVLDGADPAAVQRAAQALRAGALVAFPTETVYGLGARADDAAALAGIFAAKGRPADHPLIVHVRGLGEAGHFSAELGATATRLAQHFWPGPLTLIVPRRPGVAEVAAAGQASIGLRAPQHPVARALLDAAAQLGVPGVAAPSANRFGRVSPTTAAHVRQELGSELLVLDGGACPVGIESAIVDCTRPARPALLRPGSLRRADIEAVLGQALADADADSPRAAGTLASHYAPNARLRLLAPVELQAALRALETGSAAGVAVYSRSTPGAAGLAGWRLMPAVAADTARELFAVLRAFDDAGARQIWVECPPADPAWDGVNDRLRRAAAA